MVQGLKDSPQCSVNTYIHIIYIIYIIYIYVYNIYIIYILLLNLFMHVYVHMPLSLIYL